MFFNPETVGKVYYINHDGEAGRERREAFERMAEELTITATRISAVYGNELPAEQQADVLNRTKAKVFDGNRWIDNLETNALLPEHVSTADDVKGALAKYGCQQSHIVTMERALAERKEGDDRWIIIFEDDVYIDPQFREFTNQALRDAPADAGVFMLTGIHRLWSGAIPVNTADERFMLPVQTSTTPAIAYRPAMMEALLQVYQKNAAMTREEGGISAIDHVNAVLQEWQTLGNIPERNEHAVLVQAFAEALETATLGQPGRFYALNPFPIGITEAESTLGSQVSASQHLQGKPIQALPLDIAKEVRALVGEIERSGWPDSITRMRDAIDMAVKEGSLSPDELIGKLRELQEVPARTIVHLIPAKGWGGTERALHNVISHAPENEWHVIVSSTEVGQDFLSYFHGVAEVVEISAPHPHSGWRETGAALGDAIEAAGADMVVSWMPHCNKYTGQLSQRFPDLPVMWYEHSARERSDMNAWTTQIMRENSELSYRVPEVVAYCSNRAQDAHVGQWGFNADNAVIIPVGVDLGRFQYDVAEGARFRDEMSIPADAKLIGTIARFDDQKDIAAFVKTAAEISNRAVDRGEAPPYFLICGDGATADNPDLMAMLESAGIAAHTVLPGIRDDMPAVYSALDLAVSTSRRESFGLSALEALACGVPFAATDAGMFRTILQDDALIVPVREADTPIEGWSPQAMADSWEHALHQHEGISSQEAREHLRQKAEPYSAEQVSALFHQHTGQMMAQAEMSVPHAQRTKARIEEERSVATNNEGRRQI